MKNNWRQYLDEEFEDEHTSVQRIPHRPKTYDQKKEREDQRPPKPATKTTKN